jgi:hypothetical protein
MRKFWGPFEHNFPSSVSVFYFLSPRLILTYYSLPSPFVWPFSFNIPSCSSTPPPLLYGFCELQHTSQRTRRGQSPVGTHLRRIVMRVTLANRLHGFREM